MDIVPTSQYSYQDSIISEVSFDPYNITISIHNIQSSHSSEMTLSFQDLLGHNFTHDEINNSNFSRYDLNDVNVYVELPQTETNLSYDYLIFLNYFNRTASADEYSHQSIQHYSSKLIRYNEHNGVTQIVELPNIGPFQSFHINERLGLFALLTYSDVGSQMLLLNPNFEIVNTISFPFR